MAPARIDPRAARAVTAADENQNQRLIVTLCTAAVARAAQPAEF
jgi:hypothetical protein